MRLEAFRIKNYRSIVDTGWVNVSPDNITTIIGQNESGKTSILEALYSFFNGKIHEDILRSDMKYPEISCAFLAEKDFLGKRIPTDRLSPHLVTSFKQRPLLYLSRIWKNSHHSYLIYGNDEILEASRENEQKELEIEELLLVKIEKLLNETSRLTEIADTAERDLRKYRSELDGLETKYNKLIRSIERASMAKREGLKHEAESCEKKINEIKKLYTLSENNFNNHNEKLSQLIIKSGYAGKYKLALENVKKSEVGLKEITNLIEKLKFEIQINPSRRRSAKVLRNLKESEERKKQIKSEVFRFREMLRYAKECIQLALQNTRPEDIEVKARENYEKKEEQLDLEELALLIFPFVPEFALFEDFSSLLPNRIDLEDMLLQNENTEGFNAVKNFLIVSGLDSSFFNEVNTRILKSKIENLNGEISLHFQDYWRQNLGRSNKIKINFELEHYDLSDPEKKGKPYLEFWIKDEKERLYPKQRSRGVRWFLSFFLELKATAQEESSRKKILLIDEPGLSLHARAQEDVLKVFEDLKSEMQIIYTTHSPHLVNTEKLHRLLAVQRADEFNDHSETLVFDPQKLSQASGDTLSPIYTLMGTRLSESNFIQERNNIIVEDTHVFYYLKNIFDIFSKNEKIYFLPSTGARNIPLLVNMMIGWKLHYAVFLCDHKESREIYVQMRELLFRGNDEECSEKVLMMKGVEGIENLFSTIDFKKHVLNKRVGITESNLEYIADNNLSKSDLASAFAMRCHNLSLKQEDFDEETRENFRKLTAMIASSVKN
ncbi:MAG: AAA family ATPase [Bacteroidales bacterium]|nr:AAA family ATPase [Bacteroidales bacterium]